ncbi:PREDICTED: sperm-associated antigen 4 protein-like [Papilio polytes]|uniref:sperm-associated antigen 4 protein-like n=1 Tax=Papilio polytes TaxID=76194 RepID=UPI0006763F0E|nr:PREDICTED: sperm-associated antigen 4 protein-like [Papilio polytes]
MVSRSACGKACNSFSSSDISQNNIIPPWCSSARLSRKKKRPEFTLERDTRSSNTLHDNIWEYHDDKDLHNFVCGQRKTAKNCSKQMKCKQKGCGICFQLLIFFLLTLGCTMTFWKYDLVDSEELIKKVITKTKFIFPSMDEATSVDGCRRRMGHLAGELSRAQRALRATLRFRRTLMLTTQSVQEFSDKSVMQRGYVAGVGASKGSDTREWGGRVALWGVLPLWRAAPPPDTVLALRPPAPADCWPFSGSHGEVVIEFARTATLSQMSVEHVRPDTARSAPKNFLLYSILENNTRVESARGAYTYNRPAKQYFPLTARSPVRRVAFTVLSNQGNERYTCLYRIHFYASDLCEMPMLIALMPEQLSVKGVRMVVINIIHGIMKVTQMHNSTCNRNKSALAERINA